MANKKIWGIFALVSALNFSYSYAQDCDSAIVDEPRVLGDQFDRVEEAVRKVQNLGAEVKVRIYSSTRYKGNLDLLQDELQSRCLSWRANDGGIKNNLISLLLAVDDRDWGFYVGSQWAT